MQLAHAPSAFEVKLRERLNAMPQRRQYRLVKIGMLVLLASIALCIIKIIVQYLS
jgi:hypothetical protein